MGKLNAAEKKRKRPFVIQFYGHSHVRRFKELLGNEPAYTRKYRKGPPALDTCNAELGKVKEEDKLKPDMGFNNATLDFVVADSKDGYSTEKVSTLLYQNRGSARDLQVIYVGDNDQRGCPDPKLAAERIFATIKSNLPYARGPTITAGLLPRWKDASYCKWAGKVNELLIEKIKAHNSAPHTHRIIWMQHLKELAMNSAPEEVFGSEKLHKGVVQPGTGAPDYIHLNFWAYSKFYFAMKRAIMIALSYLK